jgi:YXWGXW repeat-containing protein
MRMILVRSLLFAVMMLALAVNSSAGIIFSVVIAPPPLPVYEQPFCPGDGYLWVPGYWAYDGDDGYFWVPGTWVLAPAPGFLWTPGYWGWDDGFFIFHEGYWGPVVGFYGGINYGYGYFGSGYDGGYWNNGAFFYNRSVNRVTNVTNVYNKTVTVNNVTVNNVSYNGGVGGIPARPTPEQQAALRERHVPPTPVQTQHLQAASANRQLFESVNHGKPPIAATTRPAEFKGHGVVAAKAAARSYAPPTARTVAPSRANNTASRPVAAIHPNDLPPAARSRIESTGSPKLDKKYQQEQEKLRTRQEQDQRKLQQKQEQEHQRLAQSRANEGRRRQVEQKHQQETRQLEQRQSRDQQRLQDKQQPGNRNPRR